MLETQNSKARLYFTYLKDKTELLLYVKPHETSGSEIVYRRAPGDAALNERILSVLDHCRVPLDDTEIWILLYPPEIYTTTMYLPAEATASDIRLAIHEQIFSSLAYPVNYDWQNYWLDFHAIGSEENMVTVSIMGKDVLPRIKELLGENFNRVVFIGDGLQFLNIGNSSFKQLWGQTYGMILPYDEVFFLAGFRSGLHVESSVLTHACSASFGDYRLRRQQVYLDIRQKQTMQYQPRIQPVVPPEEWQQAGLTSAAFPSWFIARNSLQQRRVQNFLDKGNGSEDPGTAARKNGRSSGLHLLD